MLDLDAGMAGLSEDAKHEMLHLDDELAGLIEAADVPADPAGAHITKPEPASPVPGRLICGEHVGCCALGFLLCRLRC